MYRFNNMLALLEADLRAVPPEETYGGRNWSNYTWHGDQSPGHPFVHGLQASGVDFAARGRRTLRLRDGSSVEVMTLFDAFATRTRQPIGSFDASCCPGPTGLGDSRSARGRGGVCRDLFR